MLGDSGGRPGCKLFIVILYVIWGLVLFIFSLTAVIETSKFGKSKTETAFVEQTIVRSFLMPEGTKEYSGVSVQPNGVIRTGAGTTVYLQAKDKSVESPLQDVAELKVAYGDETQLLVWTATAKNASYACTIKVDSKERRITEFSEIVKLGIEVVQDLVFIGDSVYVVAGSVGIKGGAEAIKVENGVPSGHGFVEADGVSGVNMELTSFSEGLFMMSYFMNPSAALAVNYGLVKSTGSSLSLEFGSNPFQYAPNKMYHTIFRLGDNIVVAYPNKTAGKDDNCLVAQKIAYDSTNQKFSSQQEIVLQVKPEFFISSVNLDKEYGAIIFVDTSVGNSLRCVLVSEQQYGAHSIFFGDIRTINHGNSEASFPTQLVPFISVSDFDIAQQFSVTWSDYVKDYALVTTVLQLDRNNKKLVMIAPVMPMSLTSIVPPNYWFIATAQVHGINGYLVVDYLEADSSSRNDFTIVELAPSPFGLSTNASDPKTMETDICLSGALMLDDHLFGKEDIGSTLFTNSKGEIYPLDISNNEEFVVNYDTLEVISSSSEIGVVLDTNQIFIRLSSGQKIL
eukprot:CAMPEP_0174251076 /NCGR_PEP_ID=MMETSP0439-20130205/1026_1 /TAXON_ID=0 /ORGANISM="Stereomyxa ramosa, Strain Chinc5" /LENGTH=565 /DNA_ID=CAMNT_0015331307 /DNA_START=6 /DNA_END=1703 /DNA_ORIENTATION=-